MTVAATAWAFQVKAGGPLPKLVLIAMSDCTDHECIATIDPKSLASDCEISQDELRRVFKHLIEHGLIERVKDYPILKELPEGFLAYRLCDLTSGE